jgi:Pyruvate/2-oxoacid:ferredoxin oxidoreductase delta subunit
MSRLRFPRLIRPSTRAFWEEGRRTPGYSLFDFLHGYVYGRWPYLYIGIATGEHWIARRLAPLVRRVGDLLTRQAQRHAAPASSPGFADTYHGKVVPPAAARQLIMVQQEVNLPELEHIIPYAMARDIVLKNPDRIAVLDCPCRASRPNPCLPLDVCLIVGEPFASFVVEHHPRRARFISRQEAEDILQAEHARGHVHHAFFKDAMLGRFYAICNCCSCCCGAMQAMRAGVPMLASSGYVARQRAEEECAGCGECAAACPFQAIEMRDGRAWVMEKRCMGCGVCVDRCPSHILRLEREPAKGEPLEILSLLSNGG